MRHKQTLKIALVAAPWSDTAHVMGWQMVTDSFSGIGWILRVN